MRATMRGLADAIADPDAAAAIAVERINGNGNPNFLSPEGEAFRWTTDADAIVATDARRAEHRCPDRRRAARPRSTPTTRSVCTATPAPRRSTVASTTELVAGLYDDAGTVIWPA